MFGGGEQNQFAERNVALSDGAARAETSGGGHRGATFDETCAWETGLSRTSLVGGVILFPTTLVFT